MNILAENAVKKIKGFIEANNLKISEYQAEINEYKALIEKVGDKKTKINFLTLIYLNKNHIEKLMEFNEMLEKAIKLKEVVALEGAILYSHWIDSTEYTEELRGKIQAFIEGLESR